LSNVFKILFKRQLENIRLKRREYFMTMFELLLAGVIGFLTAGLILFFIGYNPVEIYQIMFRYGFYKPDYLLSRSVAVMMAGLAFSIPALAGFFNIGGESQLYVGGFICLITTYYTGNVFIGLITGFLAGGLYGLILAVLRVYRGINEVITAIMINWLTYYIILYLILKYFLNPIQPHYSIQIPREIMLTPYTTFTLAVIASIIAYVIIYHTELGYTIRLSGLSFKSAVYAGLNPRKAILYSLFLGGGYAGLGGALHIAGLVSGFDTTMSAVYGLGFMGIGVGLMGRNNPLGIILASIFYSGLVIGGQWVELKTGAPPYLADIIIGIVIIALSIPYAYRLIISYLTRKG